MKKTLILIFLFVFFITGCSDTSNVHKLDEQEKDSTSDILLKREEERNMKVISKLQTLLNKTYNTNYAFEYNISYLNETYKYNGEKYYNVIQGIYNDTYGYQIENHKFYNSSTFEKTESIYYNLNYDLINLNEYVSKINNDYTCTMSNNISICEAIFKNISITFYYNDDYITEILFIDDNATYNLKYSDFNNIDPIPLVEDEEINITYNTTNNIEKIEVTEDVDYPYTVYNYYVANSTVNINDEESEVVGNMEIFNNPMYYRDYTNNIIDKVAYKKVEEYIYNDNFIIIVINNDIYYLSTIEYEDEILSQYIEN